jgi:hypothetical protein
MILERHILSFLFRTFAIFILYVCGRERNYWQDAGQRVSVEQWNSLFFFRFLFSFYGMWIVDPDGMADNRIEEALAGLPTVIVLQRKYPQNTVRRRRNNLASLCAPFFLQNIILTSSPGLSPTQFASIVVITPWCWVFGDFCIEKQKGESRRQ